MTGTLVNVAGIVLGSLIGVTVKKALPERLTAVILRTNGLCVAVIALNGIIASMFTVNPQDGSLTDSGGLLLLVSMIIGCVVGEIARLDDHINTFGKKLETNFGVSGFAKGFVSASLIFPIGAMSLIGAINDGLTGDSSVLLIKSLLDGIVSIVLASSLGIGVLFSCVPVFLLQGSVSLMAGRLEPLITPQMLDSFCMVGYSIVLVIGLNFLLDTKIKVANLLPALVIPVLYHSLFPM